MFILKWTYNQNFDIIKKLYYLNKNVFKAPVLYSQAIGGNIIFRDIGTLRDGTELEKVGW